MIRSFSSCINFTLDDEDMFEADILDKTSSPNNLTDDVHRELYLKAQFITGLILYPLFCVFGLCGNGLSILVLSLKKMRTPTNIYLISLAVSDSIKLINDFLYFVSILCLNLDPDHLGRAVYATLYPYAHYFFNMSVFCTAWITVSVAIERYILVCHPARAKVMCNFNRAKLTCVAVFILTAVLTIPHALRYKTISVYNSCEEKDILEVIVSPLWKNKAFVITYTWLHNSLRTLVPIIIVSALNYFIVKSLRETRKRRKNKRNSLHRITVMLISVIIVFVICITPDAIISTIFRYGYYEANYLVRAIREVTDLLLLLNSATNFILYCIFNSVFRQNFAALFCTMEGEKAYLFKRDITAYNTNASMAMYSSQKSKVENMLLPENNSPEEDITDVDNIGRSNIYSNIEINGEANGSKINVEVVQDQNGINHTVPYNGCITEL